ncbi:MAG: TrpB-like pyridoxal phosphate-dependent enzyme [Candidatus Korarchaeota archaeon]|nr:TrpB-like pyridoxal phosphate-dependent enzyme [Candidatus Korarchaeota archaeon]
MIRVNLAQEDIPKYWYNIVSDLPYLPPPIHPATKEPLGPKDFYPLFPKECVNQEFSKEKYIAIPEELREFYIRIGRPTPLYRAKRLEEYLRTPARVYYKREDVSPTGSHKLNTALVQAFFAAREGLEYLTTETGAGQWGSALSYATAMVGLRAMVFMVRISYEQKPYRKLVMKLYGADVVPSPSNRTEIGRKYLEQNPNHPGSLGIAISEAIEMAMKDEKAKYSLGSVLNHVLLHQTIVGLEAKKQFELVDEKPDVLIGCVGGGSNFAGFTFPFIEEILSGKENYDVLAIEPKAAPSLTEGEYRYDFGDSAGVTPLIKMFTLGHDFVPPPIHAGGLRYHGAAPTVSLLKSKGIVRSVAYTQEEVFEAGRIFAMTEGMIPAPETTHAVKAAIDEALKAKKEGKERVIAFNFSGHGLLDLKGYEDVLGL